jgi:hypothetical protein
VPVESIEMPGACQAGDYFHQKCTREEKVVKIYNMGLYGQLVLVIVEMSSIMSI